MAPEPIYQRGEKISNSLTLRNIPPGQAETFRKYGEIEDSGAPNPYCHSVKTKGGISAYFVKIEIFSE
jgi:hypothetical protein